MIDNVDVADKKWEFDDNVAKCFGDMLSRSIPEYTEMRELTYRVGRNFVKQGYIIVDIGCSNGDSIEDFVNGLGATSRYALYEVSPPMLANCRERYKSWIDKKLMTVNDHDIRQGISNAPATLALSVLTLQFTPIEYRQKIVQSIYDNLIEGGAFILVEKVLGNTFELDSVMVDEYYKIKAENAYTEKQIRDKRKSLEGVLVPVTAKWNEDLLRQCGFRKVDCFWRCLNFAAWVAIK